MTRISDGKQKYGAVRTEVDGITFASAKEAARYKELRLLEAAGEIHGLRCQVRMPLHAYHFVSMRTIKVADYVADFVYRRKGEDSTSTPVVEDVKGYRTQLYALKRRWVRAEYDIDIQEV